jgi:hypothetical protein
MSHARKAGSRKWCGLLQDPQKCGLGRKEKGQRMTRKGGEGRRLFTQVLSHTEECGLHAREVATEGFKECGAVTRVSSSYDYRGKDG